MLHRPYYQGQRDAILSHVDTTTGFLFFNFEAEFCANDRTYIDSQTDGWDSHQPDHKAFLTDHCTRLLYGKSQRKYLHEWCHMLKMVWFPCWYVHTWKELTIAFRLRQALRSGERALLIGKLNLISEWVNLVLEQRDGPKQPVTLADLERLASDPTQEWTLLN
jgi:hypothetical protein